MARYYQMLERISIDFDLIMEQASPIDFNLMASLVSVPKEMKS